MKSKAVKLDYTAKEYVKWRVNEMADSREAEKKCCSDITMFDLSMFVKVCMYKKGAQQIWDNFYFFF